MYLLLSAPDMIMIIEGIMALAMCVLRFNTLYAIWKWEKGLDSAEDWWGE